MKRRLFSLFIVFVLCFGSLVCASANDCSFCLSDASVKKGRLFEIEFSLNEDEDISAFVAEYTFDSKYLKFDSCKTARENALVELNQADRGRVRIVYLCKDGINTRDNGLVLTLTFKALQEGNTEIACDISQVINNEYEDITALSCDSAKVSIYSTHKDIADETEIIQNPAEESTEVYSKTESTVVEGNATKSEIVIFSVLTVLCLVSAVGFVSYKLGKKKSGKKENNEK